MNKRQPCGKRKSRCISWNINTQNLKEQDILMKLNENKIDIRGISKKRRRKGSIDYPDCTFPYNGKVKHTRETEWIEILIKKSCKTEVKNITYKVGRTL